MGGPLAEGETAGTATAAEGEAARPAAGFRGRGGGDTARVARSERGADTTRARGDAGDGTLDAEALRVAVLGWYARHGRTLGIRTLRDPYAIWVAETMSQQTQIARVERALPAFLERFPTVHALADASAADVIR